MTALQNETLTEIAKRLDDLNATLPPEEKLSITGTSDLDAVVSQKNKLLGVYKKLAPVFALANGKADPMEALPLVMPAIQNLKGDEQLSKDLEEIMALVK